jgi:hypothetical protein
LDNLPKNKPDTVGIEPDASSRHIEKENVTFYSFLLYFSSLSDHTFSNSNKVGVHYISVPVKFDTFYNHYHALN